MHDIVILVTRDGLGHTSSQDADFGRAMLDTFWHTLERRGDKPLAVCFYTEGVQVARRDHPCHVSLQILKGRGVPLIACKTCLAHYGIAADMVVADVDGMPRIVEYLSSAAKVITI